MHSMAMMVDDDLLTVQTFIGIFHANTFDYTARWNPGDRFGSISETMPDTMRAPLSIYALAKSLGLVYETVRRHVHKLRRAGLCVVVGDGVIVPEAALQSPKMDALIGLSLECNRQFVEQVAAAGYRARSAPASSGQGIERQAIRLSIAYFIESLGILRQATGQDTVAGLILLNLGMANLRPEEGQPLYAMTYHGVEDIAPDQYRRPVSVYAIAKGIHMPYETIRRHMLRLQDLGLVEKVGKLGLVVPASVMARPQFMQGVVDLAELTLQFIEQLAEIGVAAGPAS